MKWLCLTTTYSLQFSVSHACSNMNRTELFDWSETPASSSDISHGSLPYLHEFRFCWQKLQANTAMASIPSTNNGGGSGWLMGHHRTFRQRSSKLLKGTLNNVRSLFLSSVFLGPRNLFLQMSAIIGPRALQIMASQMLLIIGRTDCLSAWKLKTDFNGRVIQRLGKSPASIHESSQKANLGCGFSRRP